ncbi:MAG: DUF167 domain-containing protein [Candidatus Hydrogenedentes bacterium]|nr:DUF167 domain-containing protein [Candidatus Hydrogenedentota bacterium]
MTESSIPSVKEEDGGILLRIRVQPRASRAGVRIAEDGTYRVAVTAPPVDDAANLAVCAYLSKTLGVAKRKVTIAAGEHSRLKTVRVAGMGMTEILDKLRDCINR